MYIEFQLPNVPYSHGLLCVRKDLVDWSEKYGIPFTEKTVKHTHRVCLSKPEEYTFFLTSWRPFYSGEIEFKVIDIP